jgi:hypothetical protein
MRRAVITVAAAVTLLVALGGLRREGAAPAAQAATTGTPRREERGDLIVLYLYGSYYDMGRQQAQLLGPVAQRMYAYHLDKYRRGLAAGGLGLRVQDFGMRLLTWVGPWYEQSGFFDEMNGIADGLGVPRADLLRAVVATAFGSTVFAATRSATQDGGAIIGRNVDWDDGDGTMRPVVMHFHPNNGDLAYIMGGWPLIGAPAIGMNEAGLALSFNFFVADEVVGVPPQMRDRRALQTAKTVDEGLRVFTAAYKRAMPTFMVMADANGDIAMIECTPSAYAIFRPPPDQNWFAQANHARTRAMIPFDRYRSPDSFERRAAMEAAVRPHLGAITPAVAAQILRDRSNSNYVNDNTVANLSVLNAAVLQPGTKTLWHSTTMQPQAPFGEMVPFSVAADVSAVPPLPAAPGLGGAAMQREAAVVAEARWAVRAYQAGDVAGAGAVWDGIAARQEPLLHPDRLAYARALVRLRQGKLDEADALLATVDAARAPFEVRATALALRAAIAAHRGRRDRATEYAAQARVYLDAHPEYTDGYTQALREAVGSGAVQPLTDKVLLDLPDLQRVPP